MDKDKFIKDVQEGGRFGFIPAILKLRKAELQDTGVTLTKEEVKATIEAFRLLRDNHRG